MERVLIAGVGDKLRRDDGFGCEVVNQLSKIEFPKHVVIREYGTSSLDLLYDIGDFDEVVIVDAVDFGGTPGEIFISEVKPEKASQSDLFEMITVSFHELRPKEILRLSKALEKSPKKVFLIGCQPGDLSFGVGLSSKVREAVNKVVGIISEKVRREF